MKQYPDFWHVILGDTSAGAFLAFTAFAMVAALVSILINLSMRDQNSPATPTKVSLAFWFAHNLTRALANLLATPLIIRLLLAANLPPTMMVFLSIGIGAGIDRLAMLLKNMGVLTTNKLAEKVKDKIDQQ
jgi:hypothetical protein